MKLIDTTLPYETPEGIRLRLRKAGPVARGCAWLIDLALKGGICLIVSMFLSYLAKTGMGIYMIILFLVEWFYSVLFEVRTGATPGKKAMNLLVINDNGTPITFMASTLRNLIRAADFFPFCYGAGLITMLINNDFKRLGDLAAGTLVVYEEKVAQYQTIVETAPKQPPADLRVNEQRTLLDFSERSQYLSPERCIELAEILFAITGKKGTAAAEELYAYASWLFKGK